MVDLNEEIFEKLSALQDGELSDFETRQLLKQIDQLQADQRSQVYAYWQRMQLVSDCMSSDQVASSSDLSFVNAVSSAISEEESVDLTTESEAQSQESGSAAYLKPAAESSLAAGVSESADIEQKVSAPAWSRFAVAASVALAVIVGVQQIQISDQNQLLANASQQQVQTSVEAIASDDFDSQRAELLAQIEAASSAEEQLYAQQRLIDHLIERKQQSAGNVDPFARVANFEEEASSAETSQ